MVAGQRHELGDVAPGQIAGQRGGPAALPALEDLRGHVEPQLPVLLLGAVARDAPGPEDRNYVALELQRVFLDLLFPVPGRVARKILREILLAVRQRSPVVTRPDERHDAGRQDHAIHAAERAQPARRRQERQDGRGDAQPLVPEEQFFLVSAFAGETESHPRGQDGEKAPSPQEDPSCGPDPCRRLPKHEDLDCSERDQEPDG